MKDNSAWYLSWLGLAIAVVVLADYPSAGPLVRYTLMAVVAYVLLTNTQTIAPVVERWVAGLGPTVATREYGH